MSVPSTKRHSFPLQELVPAELRGVLCDFVWDADKLRRLPLPVDTATVDSLRWHLDLPYWRDGGRPFQITPGPGQGRSRTLPGAIQAHDGGRSRPSPRPAVSERSVGDPGRRAPTPQG